MKLTAKAKIVNLEENKQLLDFLGFATKQLYNTVLWQKNNYFEEHKKHLSYNKQDKLIKELGVCWYQILPSQTAQAVLENVDNNFKSFFSLWKNKHKESRPPKFLKKNKLFKIVFKQKAKVLLKNNILKLTLGRNFNKEFEQKFLYLKLKFNPNYKITNENLKLVELININKTWEVRLVFQNLDLRNPEVKKSSATGVLSIDLGINNLITTFDNTTNNIRIFKNKLLEKEYYRLKTIKKYKVLSKNYCKFQRKISLQKKDILHKITFRLSMYCKNNSIGKVVIGKLTNIRKQNLGSANNFKLNNWSFEELTKMLKYKLAKFGIELIKVSESYTSQTCCICGEIKKSNRKTRGQYICSNCNTKINADGNGAINILKKYLKEYKYSISNGCVCQPVLWQSKYNSFVLANSSRLYGTN